MKTLNFSVDSALLRELGERLVGQPHIALAELVKNSYDADATKAEILFEDDSIHVIDNGHGMSLREFQDFWMRVGTVHKEKKRVSRGFKRPMTGSKGVGRLSAQFLAGELEIRTVSDKDPSTELHVIVDWSKAIKAGELTQAKARYEQLDRETEFPGDSIHGTRVVMSNLKQTWSSEDIEDLAREIWWLQPPFRANPDFKSDLHQAFNIVLETPDPEASKRFEEQMSAYLDIWYARIVGKLEKGGSAGYPHSCTTRLSLEFSSGESLQTEYNIDDCYLNSVEFEIRVYHLQHRQPHGIRVQVARDYFNEYGGVHVYDSGFHLPYYGQSEFDWLGIEQDHSHRRSKSELLPESLHVPGAMTFLPTQSRLFGIVHVNTSKERQAVEDSNLSEDTPHLMIQVSRDRLVDNKAFQNLRDIVRWAIDYYAAQEAKRRFKEIQEQRPTEPFTSKAERVEEVLDRHRDSMPEAVYSELKGQMEDVVQASQREIRLLEAQTGLLGSLATAGISALAYEHEVGRQLNIIETTVNTISGLETGDPNINRQLTEVSRTLEGWLSRARAMRSLFLFLLDEENREKEARYRALPLLRDVKNQLTRLVPGVDIDLSEVESDLRLPEATYAEWISVFQNAFTNAFNAVLDCPERLVRVRTEQKGPRTSLIIEDTGPGVDIDTSEELFEPFVRRLELSPEREELQLGGTGLGLSIVRMIADNIGVSVTFTEPLNGFNTAFRVTWREAG